MFQNVLVRHYGIQLHIVYKQTKYLQFQGYLILLISLHLITGIDWLHLFKDFLKFNILREYMNCYTAILRVLKSL